MKIKNILLKPLSLIGLFLIAFVLLIGYSNIIVNASEIETQAEKTQSSTYSLKDAIIHKMNFTTLYFDSSVELTGNFNPLTLVSTSEDDVFYDIYSQYQLYDFMIYVPVYSNHLNRYIYGVAFNYKATDQEQYSLISMIYDFDFNVSTLENITDSYFYNLLENLNQDKNYVKIFTDYDDSEDFLIKSVDNNCNVLEFEEETNLNDLYCGSAILWSYESNFDTYVYDVILDTGTNYKELVYENMVCEGGYLDTDNPILNLPTMLVNVNNPLTFDEIKTHITATDLTEGDLTDNIEFIDNTYILDSNGKIRIGTYTYTVKVSDSSNNTTTTQGAIIVKDYDAPTGTAKNENIVYNQELSDQEIEALFNYTDNYDSIEDLIITIDKSNYLTNKNTLGKYQIVMTIEDLSGNSTNLISEITIIDNIIPVITLPKNLTISNMTPLSLEDVKRMISAIDEYDGKLDFTLTDKNGLFPNVKVGNYTFSVSATDSSNNIANKEFTIIIKDDDTPTIIFDMEYFIFVPKTQVLTENQIIQILIDNGQVKGSVENNNVKTLKTEYFSSPHKEKDYELYVELIDGKTFTNMISVVKNDSGVSNKFKIDDLLDVNYWQKLWKNYTNKDNILKIQNWNWLHYGTIIIAGVILIVIICCVVHGVRESKKKKQFYKEYF